MKIKNETILLMGLVILIIVTIVVNLSLTGKATNEDIEEYKIGIVTALSGQVSSYGYDIKNGADLAKEKINKAGEVKIILEYEDSNSDSKTALTAAQKLININHHKIIIGPPRSDSFLSIAPLAEENKIILFGTVPGSEEIRQSGDHIFRNRETGFSNGQSMGKYFNSINLDNTVIFTAQSSNSASYHEGFKKTYSGNILEEINYEPASTDFKTSINKALSKNPKAVYIAPKDGVDAATLVKQLREAKYFGLIATSPVAESSEFLEITKEYKEGVTYTYANFDINNPKIVEYKNSYLYNYNKDSNVFAANTYDAVMILTDAMISCNSDTDTACIRDYMYSIKNYNGISGTYSFDSDGEVIKEIDIKQIQGNTFIKIWQSPIKS